MAKIGFILGGNDGEMVAIKGLLSARGLPWVQPKSGWGDHAYTPRETSQIAQAETVVFVECRPADGWADKDIRVVDHHGPRSSEAASILQVIELLGINDLDAKQQREIALVAANDAAYIPGMLSLGATTTEVTAIRLADRAAQGITADHEAEAERALRTREVRGRLTVIRMDHSKTAPVCDRLFGSYDQLLILSGDGEVNFCGDGALCADLKDKFQGWNGGSGLGTKGESAFWGGYPNHDEVLAFIQTNLGV